MRAVFGALGLAGLAAVAAGCFGAAAPGAPAATSVVVRRCEVIATRRLACNPDPGGYARPGIACEALRDLTRLEACRPHRACMCPLAPPRTFAS
jgi:hypothetical protein